SRRAGSGILARREPRPPGSRRPPRSIVGTSACSPCGRPNARKSTVGAAADCRVELPSGLSRLNTYVAPAISHPNASPPATLPTSTAPRALVSGWPPRRLPLIPFLEVQTDERRGRALSLLLFGPGYRPSMEDRLRRSREESP